MNLLDELAILLIHVHVVLYELRQTVRQDFFKKAQQLFTHIKYRQVMGESIEYDI